jgi:hypothetical protein
MFIYTTDTIIKALTNTKHCSRNFKNYSIQISLFVYIHFFGLSALTMLEPSTSPTSSTFTLSLNTHPMLRRSTTSPVACEHKNRSLVNTGIPRHPLDASCITVRMTPSPSAVLWLPRHPLTALPWKDSIAIRCLAVRRLPQSPLTHYRHGTSPHV